MKFERFIIFGGCHVKGFPLGESRSFVRLVSDRLGFSDENCVIVSGVSIKRLKSSLERVGTLGPQDLVLLQMGSFETLAPLMFGKPHDARSVDQLTQVGRLEFLSAAGPFARPLTWLVRAVGNTVLHVIRELLRRPAFSTAAFAEQLFDPEIRQALSKAGGVVIVGALPTRVRVRNVYRWRANAILRAFAKSGEHVFVDYLNATKHLKDSSITIDPIHLNDFGHVILAEEILKMLAPLWTTSE